MVASSRLGVVLMVAECHIKVPLHTNSSSNVGVLGGSGGKDVSGTTARLCVDSFATLFGSQVVGRLALILYGEFYRRSAPAHNVKPRPQPACQRAIDSSEACPKPTPEDEKYDEADSCAEDINHFFIYQGNRSRRVLSAPAGRSCGQQGACSPEVHEPKVTLPQPKPSSLHRKRRGVSAHSCKRSRSETGQSMGEHPVQNSRTQVLAPALNLPESLRHSEFNDPDNRSRSARLMELMSSCVPGPIASDDGNAMLITDEIRLEVASKWGVPAIYGISSPGGGGKENTCAPANSLSHSAAMPRDCALDQKTVPQCSGRRSRHI